MNRLPRALVALALLAAAPTGCGPSLDEVIRSWLSCDECVAGELEAVVARGDDAIEPLARALRDGPSPPQIANVRAQARSDWEAVERNRERLLNSAAAGSAIDSASFLDRQVRGYVDHYRIRGLFGLTALGTQTARDSIHQLLVRDSSTPFGWSPEVRERVRAHDLGIAELKIVPLDVVGVGLSVQAGVQITGHRQNAPLVWTSSNPAILTTTISGQLTGVAAGLAVIRACWIELATSAICASRVVRVVP